MQTDLRGVPMSACNADTAARFETALLQFQSYSGDPVATIDAALAQEPQFLTGHLLRGLVLMTLAERRFTQLAADSYATARSLATHAHPREQALLHALGTLIDGQWEDACRRLENILVDHPRDVLALQVAHLFDFARGDALNLRNRIARVLPHWDAALPGYGYVLGMYAFGLEEMNQYAQAEDIGRRAVELQPKDVWGIHAVTHVMEMQGRIEEGSTWLAAREPDWAVCNGFSFHNAWHLALFHLDQGRYADVLRLYDTQIHPGPAPHALALLDATAMLWRLHLEGIDLGARVNSVADEWANWCEAESGFYAFNDMHAALAFAANGRVQQLSPLLARMQLATQQSNSNAAMTREVGLPLVQAIADFAAARYAKAAESLLQLRDIAQRFGGSHAQRDLLSLTLIEAARRAGKTALARHVTAERLHFKPHARWGQRIAERIAQSALLAAREEAAA